MSIYDVDFSIVVEDNVAVDLRQPVRIAWLNVLVSYVVALYQRFLINRASNLYFLQHTSQVTSMQGVLNDKFDNTLRRIFISDPTYGDPLWLYLESEGHPRWLGMESEIGAVTFQNPQWLYLDSEEYLPTSRCFIVNVPTDVTTLPGYDELQMQSLIDLYRLPSRQRYSIVYF